MLSIQQLGLEILGDSPKGFYMLCGPEYGIKRKYIEHLSSYYKGNKIESTSMIDVINVMGVKHLVPLVPTVYVVRYDEVFLSQLNDALASKLKSAKIAGTIIGIYEDSKACNKLNKFFPNNTASVEVVNASMVSKYLRSDYPGLEDRYIQLAANISDNYSHAQCICNSLSLCKPTILYSMSDIEISSLVGKDSSYTESAVKKAIAARSFRAVIECLPSFANRYDSIIYSFLSVAVELDKIFDSKWSDSELAEYAKLWTRADIYNLFMQTFHQLELIRSISADPENCIYYLSALLQIKRIPSIEEISS